MNATSAVSHSPLPTDPAQMSPAESANSVSSDNNSRDFAGTMSAEGAKPARKAASHKSSRSESFGGRLPVDGNQTPPPSVAAAAISASATRGGAAPAGTLPTPSPTTPLVGDSAGVTVAGGASSASAAAVAAAALAASQAATGPAPASGDQKITATAAGQGAAGQGAAGQGAAAQGAAAQGAAAPTRLTNVGGASPQDLIGRSKPSAPAVSTPKISGPDGSKTTTAGLAAARVSDAKGVAGASAPDAAPFGAGNPDTQGAAPTDPAAMSGALAVANDSIDADSTLSAADSAAPASGAKGSATGDAGIPTAAMSAAALNRQSAAAATTVQAVVSLTNFTAADKHSRNSGTDAITPDAAGDSAAGLAQVTAGTSTASDVVPTPVLKVSAGVDSQEFGQGVADRVSWMVGNNLTTAKLQVNPAQLGPIEVKIAVQGGHAQVWMTSHSAVTRDALESSSAKLREMLGAQGFGQVSVDISHRSFQERSPQPQTYDWTPSSETRGSPAPIAAASGPSSRTQNSALDAYA